MDLWAVCHALNSKNRPKKKNIIMKTKNLYFPISSLNDRVKIVDGKKVYVPYYWGDPVEDEEALEDPTSLLK